LDFLADREHRVNHFVHDIGIISFSAAKHNIFPDIFDRAPQVATRGNAPPNPRAQIEKYLFDFPMQY
jgi:hypothetical protein